MSAGGDPGVTATPGFKNPLDQPMAAGTQTAGMETRQGALATLTRVAEYFRQTEPHSPISYALEQAVRWARLPLPELLSELVADQSTREEIFKRTGITPPKADK
jgi:type VI secretion system protein ImpA